MLEHFYDQKKQHEVQSIILIYIELIEAFAIQFPDNIQFGYYTTSEA